MARDDQRDQQETSKAETVSSDAPARAASSSEDGKPLEGLDLEGLDLTVETVEERISPSETNVFDK